MKIRPLHIAAWQIGVGVLGGLVWSGLTDWSAFLPALSAGLIAAILNVVFIKAAFKAGPGDDPHAMLRALFIAEALKLGLSVVLFAAAVIVFQQNALPLITTYVATLPVLWITLFSETQKG